MEKFYLGAIGLLLVMGNGVFGSTQDCSASVDVELSSNGTPMKFCSLPAASAVRIGSENGSFDERPVVERDFHSFQMAQYEVTQRQYETVMGESPWKKFVGKQVEEGADNPAVGMRFADTKEFARRVSNLDPSAEYRLPTEAEWEYAARGTEFQQSNYYWGDKFDAMFAFFRVNSGGHGNNVKTCPDKTKLEGYCANDYGLMHMLGNVWEWTLDAYASGHDGTHRDGHFAREAPDTGGTAVVKGSAWNDSPRNLRSANRFGFWDGTRPNVGFRLVRIEK